MHFIHATSRSCRVEFLQASYIPNTSSAPHKRMAISRCTPHLLLFSLPVSGGETLHRLRQEAFTDMVLNLHVFRGGSLVYEYAVGVQQQGEGPEIAKKQQ